MHLVDVSRLTDKFLLLTLDGINSAEEEKIIDPIILLSPQLYTSGADITFSQQHPISQCDLASLFDFRKEGSSAFCVLEESPHQLLHLLAGNLLGQRTLSDQNVICDVVLC